VGLQHFHYTNLKDSFDLTLDEVRANRKDRIIATSCTQIIEESLQAGQHQNAKGYGRLILHLKDGTTAGLPG
jgi:5'-nucleotidase